MNFKKGVSAVTVVIIIVVMSLITSGVVITGSKILAKANLKQFASEMLQVKKSVEEYKIRKNGELDFQEYTYRVGKYDLEKIEQFSGETFLNSCNDVTLSVIDLNKLDIENLKYGKGETPRYFYNDLYYWSETTGKIYYGEGYRYSKTTVFYTLTDELMELVK